MPIQSFPLGPLETPCSLPHAMTELRSCSRSGQEGWRSVDSSSLRGLPAPDPHRHMEKVFTAPYRGVCQPLTRITTWRRLQGHAHRALQYDALQGDRSTSGVHRFFPVSRVLGPRRSLSALESCANPLHSRTTQDRLGMPPSGPSPSGGPCERLPRLLSVPPGSLTAPSNVMRDPCLPHAHG